ncbi:Glutamine synthetase type I [Candidatus Rhodobacter oscarellae]|uniref:Glutamine synthetase type I n=1 Tax=Candidatus Rhodobacter oscarellae TaxID=1675527 RepID=A0A0J9E7M2_9RHOB|nr:type III glutamate--ammonia ligase [Candidatus Rhodobacter lobularis]KMW57779.1 Glutamine synthetase type I [Candidatus Rhodobacter lobularis]
MTDSLHDYAQSNGVKFFLFNFTDLFGHQRAKLVPASAAADMQESGAGFAGFASWLDMTPAHPDMFVMPDPSSVIQLPWKPEVAWVAGDPWMDGAPVAQAPRNVLKSLREKAGGKQLMTGVEPEFHLINADGSDISDPRDTQEKPCYDQSALLRRFDVISEICSTMEGLGWGPYQNDHEDANGQFEINWDYGECLQTADRLAFFKFMVKEIAARHELRATFMPKPFGHITGNGCHVHISMMEGGAQLFADDNDPEGMGLSQDCYHFIGGLMAHAQGLAAITNPTVNSYKRLNAPVTASGATWSPNTVSYGGNNRTHMIRIPDAGRIEFRLADGAANPYLLMAGILAAGLDGIETQADPGKRLDIDMYSEAHKARGVKKLPLNLLDALRAFKKDRVLGAAMGAEFTEAYLKLKHANWTDYTRHLTDWERQQTLDC